MTGYGLEYRGSIPDRVFSFSFCLKTGSYPMGTGKYVIAAAAHGWDSVTHRREHLTDQDLGKFIPKMEAGRRPERRDAADHSPIYKNYRAQRISLVVRTGVQKHRWEQGRWKNKDSTNSPPLKDVLAEAPQRTFRMPCSQ